MSSLMHQGRATYAFFERNWNLTRRYWGWELVWLVYNIVNAMSVTYIGLSNATFGTAIVFLLLGSISFIGFGIATAVLPLLYTEKGMQMSFIVRAVILLVSGVYYPVEALPQWMHPIAYASPATYVIEG